MSLTRRDLLRGLLALPVAAAVDWEQLLWVPKPIITVPALPFPLREYSVSVPITLDELNAITMKHIMPGLIDRYFTDSPLLKYLENEVTVFHGVPSA